MDLEKLQRLPIFERLTQTQLSQLVAVSQESSFDAGTELWREGTPADTWWILLEGSVTLLRRVGSEEAAVGVMGTPGQWAGGFAAWDPNALCFATGRAAEPSRLLQVPAVELHRFGDEWFAFGVHFIRGLVDTVRRVESSARQREALVALGTLAAGLAHELNNPASAATRAVDALESTSQEVASALGRLHAHDIGAEQLTRVGSLRLELTPSLDRGDALALADREDELSGWLAKHGVARDWMIAPVLAGAGVDIAWCDRVLALVGPDALEPAVEWIASSLTMSSLLAEVKDATGRISALVAAARSYSQLDRAGMQRVDVTEGLESTLVMLAHKLGPSMAVERDFADDLPAIQAIPGELNQVWTNLIDNAVDAMDGSGTLQISARTDELGGVVVEVVDSGPGMPPEVQARAFEPFYTTKDVGKGTGLGLDISRRIIVERHGGDIAIDSRPGRTALRVVLPVRASGASQQ